MFEKIFRESDNPVIGICWNCGKEIRLHDTKFFINEEVWCEVCASRGGYDE